MKHIDQVQLLAILVLVVGVGGGLLAVIAVIYLYKFCFQPPEEVLHDSKTSNGFQSKATIDTSPGASFTIPTQTSTTNVNNSANNRSSIQNNSVRLPFNSDDICRETEPLFRHFAPQFLQKAKNSDNRGSVSSQNKSLLFDFANDTKKIAEIFPKMEASKAFHGRRRPSRSLDEDMPVRKSSYSKHREFSSMDNDSPITEYAQPKRKDSSDKSRVNKKHSTSYGKRQLPSTERQFLSPYYPIPPKCPVSNPTTSHIGHENHATDNAIASFAFLHRLAAPEQVRPKSAEIPPYERTSLDVEEELRRASFDSRCLRSGLPTPGGERRKLPSTEHLEKENFTPLQVSNDPGASQVCLFSTKCLKVVCFSWSSFEFSNV
ncbi:hypothetical protein DdX_11572 [Ditylenchus destructor]|uniref:Uncharacterized protein n=1 Tax=Ditylenchus destructor TaxID=166010 RepID=A0AAD4N1U4_9BILA|nr:hypothetical protein DdX_11572 [Ditylenchus destructor]